MSLFCSIIFHRHSILSFLLSTVVHPATWFKVEFPPDTKVITFRPSALQPVSDDGNPIEAYTVKPPLSRHQRMFGGSNNGTPGEPVARGKSHSNTIHCNLHSIYLCHCVCLEPAAVRKPISSKKRQTLNALDPDTWVGRQVIILTGRVAGVPAKVTSTGNGWVQLETIDGIEIAKRAFELEVIPDGERMEDYVNEKTTGRAGGGSRRSVPREVVESVSTRNTSNNDDDTGGGVGGGRKRSKSEKMMLATETKELLSTGRRGGGGGGDVGEGNEPVNRRSRNRAESFDLGDNGENSSNIMTSGPSSIGPSNSRTGSRKLTSSRSNNNNGSDDDDEPNNTNNTHIVPKNPYLRSSTYIEARRHFIVKYVGKIRDKLDHRPNLPDWKYKLNDCLGNTRLHELQAARIFDDSYCEICCVEKWPSAKFCWNESCPASPIWYKLTGVEKPIVVGSLHNTEDSITSSSSIKIIPVNKPKYARVKRERNEDNGEEELVIIEGETEGEANNNVQDKGAMDVEGNDNDDVKKPLKKMKGGDLPVFHGNQPNPIATYLMQVPVKTIASVSGDILPPPLGTTFNANPAPSSALLTFKDHAVRIGRDGYPDINAIRSEEAKGQVTNTAVMSEKVSSHGVFAGLVPLKPLSAVSTTTVPSMKLTPTNSVTPSNTMSIHVNGSSVTSVDATTTGSSTVSNATSVSPVPVPLPVATPATTIAAPVVNDYTDYLLPSLNIILPPKEVLLADQGPASGGSSARSKNKKKKSTSVMPTEV